MPGKKKSSSISRSLLLPPQIDDRLNRLCAATGLNRNALVKLVAEKAKPADIKALQER